MKKAMFSISALLIAVVAQAQWVNNGTAVCNATLNQQYPQMCTDGAGGSIITWVDGRNGNNDVYAQKLDSMGVSQWAANGVGVCLDGSAQSSAKIISDGQLGAYITWLDNRSGRLDIYMQRVDANGNPLWASNGIAVCSQESTQTNFDIIVDGNGDAILCWQDYRSRTANLYDIYVQKINNNGIAQWTTNGVGLSVTNREQTNPKIISDGSGGAIVVWEHTIATLEVYARRIDNTGAPQWTAGGVVICNSANNQESPILLPDGSGGAIMVWHDYRTATNNADIYAQRVNSTGSVQWLANGVQLCNTAGNQLDPQIIADGNTGALISWRDYVTNANGCYMQRINNTGGSLWQSNGVKVSKLPLQPYDYLMTTDNAGGAYISFRPANNQIWTQWVDSTSKARFDTTGKQICTATTAGYPVCLSVGRGKGFTVWHDNREGNYNIYSQWLDTLGWWGHNQPTVDSVKDVAGDQGGKLSIIFSPSYRETIADTSVYQYSVWQRVNLTKTVGSKIIAFTERSLMNPEIKEEVIAKDSKGDFWYCIGVVPVKYLNQYGIFAPTLLDSISGTPNYQYYLVTAHTKDPRIYWDSSIDSGYSVDNIAPAKVINLNGNAVGYNVTLNWLANTEHDLKQYAVYRDGAYLGITTDTSYLDNPIAQCDYYVTAIDIHDNEGVASNTWNTGPLGVTGKPSELVPTCFKLGSANPNPASKNTIINYQLSKASGVKIQIYNVSGQAIKTIVYKQQNAGYYQVVWNCKDNIGKKVSAGVYLYRLEAGGFIATNKLVVVK